MSARHRTPLPARIAMLPLLAMMALCCGTAQAANPHDGEALTPWVRAVLEANEQVGNNAELRGVTAQADGSARIRLQRDGGPSGALVVFPSPADPKAAPAAERLRSLAILRDPRALPPELDPIAGHVIDALRAADDGRFADPHARTGAALHGQRRDPGGPPVPGQLPIVWFLTLLLPLAALAALFVAWQSVAWQSVAGQSKARSDTGAPGATRLFLSALPVAWLLRLLAPHHLVKVYFGYLHVDQAAAIGWDTAALGIPRYGAAAAVLHRGLFALFGAHHHVIMLANTALGACSCWLLAAWVARRSAPGPTRVRVAATIAWALALLPLSVFDHGTESLLVVGFFAWLVGVTLLDGVVDEHTWAPTKRWALALLAVVALAFAGHTRPDLLLLAGPAWLLGALARPRAADTSLVASMGETLRRALPPALAAIALCVPAVLFVQARAADDAAMGNLPRLGLSFFLQLPRMLSESWVVFAPRYLPLGLTVLGLVGLALWLAPRWARATFGVHGRALTGTVAMPLAQALLWAVPMLLDFNETSMLRLHAPSAMWWTAAAAATAALVLQSGGLASERTMSRRATSGRATTVRQGLALALAAVFALSALRTVPHVFAPQLSVLDDAFLQRVGRHAADGVAATYVTRGYDDAPDRGIHLFSPRYLLEADDRWLPISHLLDRPRVRREAFERGPVYYVAGARCFAALRREGQRFADGQHPACLRACESLSCAPVFEQTLSNVGERAFDWYPPSDGRASLPVGLWRMRESSAPSGHLAR